MIETSTRVLVTGAGGFIGTELCAQLVDRGYEVNALLGREEKTDIDFSLAPVNRFTGDIRNKPVLDQALDGVEIVFHLAGIAHVEGVDRSDLQNINVAGTAALIESAKAARVRKIVYFSSSLAAAPEKGKGEVTDYGESKYQAERLLRQAQENSELAVCILRPVNVYGAGMKGSLMSMIRLIAKGILPPLPEINVKFSLIGVTDLCRAAILAAGSESSGGRIYTVTDGLDYGINDLEEAVYRALGKQKPRWRCPRMLLYAAAAGAGLFNRISGRNSSIGTRTYKNLVSGNTFSGSLIRDELRFKPSATFYTELTTIIADEDRQS